MLTCLSIPAFRHSRSSRNPRCFILCAPELKLEPTWTIEHLAWRHRIESDGQIERVKRENVFEPIFALDVPTTIPRIGLTLEAIFCPPAARMSIRSPARRLKSGRGEIRDNGVEIESELNIKLFDTEQTGGWVSSHFDVVDKVQSRRNASVREVSIHTS